MLYSFDMECGSLKRAGAKMCAYTHGEEKTKQRPPKSPTMQASESGEGEKGIKNAKI